MRILLRGKESRSVLGRPALALLLLAVSVLGFWGDAKASPRPGTADPAPVIIQFKRPAALSPGGQHADAIRQAVREAGEDRTRLKTALGRVSPRHDYRLVFNGVAATIERRDIERVRALPYVADVFPDRQVSIALNDSVPLIGADAVWAQVGATGSGIRIAVIDTGVDYTHPDLGSCFGAACKVVGGYDFVNGDPDPADDHGHGTHVAGIAAANGAIKGVAPDARILAYKALNAGGSGWDTDIIAALEVAVDPDGNPATDDGADVINLSLGGPGDPDDPLSQAVDTVVAAGTVVAVAAGNSGSAPETIGSPGTARRAITVGATDKFDAMAWFSSRGPVIWDGGAIIKPDIVAPGVGICSSRWDGAWAGLECIDAQHVALSGTSMATPHVAGAAALLLDAHPDWTASDVKAALRNSTLDLGYEPNTQGYGRLQVLLAAQIPHAPPSASIETSGLLTALTDIRGTAAGTQFSRYTLELGPGMGPQSWMVLQQSSTPVVDGVLKSALDPFGLAEGFHTLRLTVESTDGLVSEDRVLIEIDNIRIDAPLNNDIERKGGLVVITGSILTGPAFQNYSVQWGEGRDPPQWFSSGITLPSGGTVPILGGTLAQWDTAAVGAGSYFSLRVVVTNIWGQTAEHIRDLYLDPTLKVGWPQRIPEDTFACPSAPATGARFYSVAESPLEGPHTPGALNTVSDSEPGFAALAAQCSHWVGKLEPVVSDLDGDGDKEIVVYIYGEPPEVRAYRDDGSLLWSVLVGSGGLPGDLHIPVIVDLDNDGRNEVVVYVAEIVSPLASGRLYAFRHDGTLVPGWPVTLPFDFHTTLLAADLDRDGSSEVIVKSNSSLVGRARIMSVVSAHGGIASQWDLGPVSWSAGIVSTPAVGNLDADPQLEIVVADPAPSSGYDPNTGQWNNTGVIYVYNADGSVVPGWPVYPDGIIFSSPAVGDIDNNGGNDVVVSLTYQSDIFPDSRYGGVYAFGPGGNVLPGWPFEKGYNFWSSPSLGDLDGNGDLEIANSRLGSATYVLHHNGAPASGWPQNTSYSNDYYSTVLADVSGDGEPDVVTTAGSAIDGGGVYAWHYSGAAVSGFPKITEVNAEAPATVSNIDSDPLTELVASSDRDRDWENGTFKRRGSVYVWDLPSPYSGSSAHWSHFHHDVRHTGTYCPPIDSDGDALGNGCDVNNDDDMPLDVTETGCGSNPLGAGSVPERVDTPGDDDGDTVANEALPSGAAIHDCDGDGFIGSSELSITTSDQDPCGNNGWPAELWHADNRLNIADLNSFLSPKRPNTSHADDSPPTDHGDFNKYNHPLDDSPPYGLTIDPAMARWNLDNSTSDTPQTRINMGDLNAINPAVDAPTSRPPMFGGQPALVTNGGVCPWPP